MDRVYYTTTLEHSYLRVSLDTKPKNFNLSSVDKEGKAMAFPLEVYDYMALKGFMEGLIDNANELQLLLTSARRLAIISQSVYNVLHSVEAVRIWNRNPLLEWYRKKVVEHQSHAFRNYLLAVYRKRAPKSEPAPLKIT